MSWCNNVKKLRYFVYELHLHKNKQTGDVKKTNNNQPTITPVKKKNHTNFSAVTYTGFIEVAQKVASGFGYFFQGRGWSSRKQTYLQDTTDNPKLI